MITDLDTPATEVAGPAKHWALPLVGALCVAVFAVIAAGGRLPSIWPDDNGAAGSEPLTAGVPRVIQQAQVVPQPGAPDAPVTGARSLALPPGTYLAVAMLPNGPPIGALDPEPVFERRYQLADGHAVVLARVPRTEPLRGIGLDQFERAPVTVRGIQGTVLTAAPAYLTGPTPMVVRVIVWSEGIRAYQLWSHTLELPEMLAVAKQLR